MNKIQDTSGKFHRRLPVWALVLIDILGTCLALTVFAFFHLVLPRMQEQKAIDNTPMVHTEEETVTPVSTPMIQTGSETDTAASMP